MFRGTPFVCTGKIVIKSSINVYLLRDTTHTHLYLNNSIHITKKFNLFVKVITFENLNVIYKLIKNVCNKNSSNTLKFLLFLYFLQTNGDQIHFLLKLLAYQLNLLIALIGISKEGLFHRWLLEKLLNQLKQELRPNRRNCSNRKYSRIWLSLRSQSCISG